MDVLVNILKVTLEEGFMYAILALGVYITYSILDFPDLSVDGTLPLGAVLSGVLIRMGWNPWVCCLLAYIAGAVAGTVTGLLNVKLKIRPLLCGILVMTALLSVNLVFIISGTGGMSIASFFDKPTIFSTVPAVLIPESIAGYQLRVLILSMVIALICKFLLDWYLSTKSGLLLRAAGDNPQFVTLLARNPGKLKILGLALGNGFSALAGSVIAQQKGSADLQMGTGMVIIGLASVIIGISLFRNLRFLKATTKVIVGSIVYKACLSVALEFGLPTEYLKLLMAVLFTIALVSSNLLDKRRPKLS
ncbi:MAG TPA: ABC transporter permease [Clostridiaceae bacterium]|nr:ABC transporter permease [Clostridiaceae bacterium]